MRDGRCRRGCQRAARHTFLEPQVDVVDLRHPLPQGGREVQVDLQALQEPFVAHVQERGVAIEQHHGIPHIADIDLRNPAREVVPA